MNLYIGPPFRAMNVCPSIWKVEVMTGPDWSGASAGKRDMLRIFESLKMEV